MMAGLADILNGGRKSPLLGGKAFNRNFMDILRRKMNPNVGGLIGTRQQGGQIPGFMRASELGRLATPQPLRNGRGLNGAAGQNNLGNRIPEFLRRF